MASVPAARRTVRTREYMQSLLNVGGGRATPVKLLGLHSPQTRSRSPAGVVHVPGAHANEQPILIAALKGAVWRRSSNDRGRTKVHERVQPACDRDGQHDCPPGRRLIGAAATTVTERLSKARARGGTKPHSLVTGTKCGRSLIGSRCWFRRSVPRWQGKASAGLRLPGSIRSAISWQSRGCVECGSLNRTSGS